MKEISFLMSDLSVAQVATAAAGNAATRLTSLDLRGSAYAQVPACCITPPCEFCAVHMAMCPCGKNLAAGKPVCRECMGGWHVGEGRVQGVKAADVKGMSAKDVMTMMHHH